MTFQAAGGLAPYNWTLSSGSLPNGLTLQTSGLLTGTPTVTGSFPISVQVMDAAGQAVQRTLTLTIAPPGLQINVAALPNGKFEAPTRSDLIGSNGTVPYHWSLAAGGVLPAGVSLNANTGVLSGTPGQAGVWSVPVAVADSANPPLAKTVNLPLTVGLATGYAGSQNCYMPYPTTPLYYPGAAKWTVDTSGLPNPAQMYVLGANVLTGCLAGEEILPHQ